MKENGGVILSTSMTLHYNGWQGMAHATAAKSGIDGLTKTLAVEWAPFGIRVNAVAPGPIVTEGVEKAFAAGGSFETFKDVIPLGRRVSSKKWHDGLPCISGWNRITGNIFVVTQSELAKTSRYQGSPARPVKSRKSKSQAMVISLAPVILNGNLIAWLTFKGPLRGPLFYRYPAWPLGPCSLLFS